MEGKIKTKLDQVSNTNYGKHLILALIEDYANAIAKIETNDPTNPVTPSEIIERLWVAAEKLDGANVSDSILQG